MRLIIFEQSETRNEVHSVCVGVVSYFGRPADLSAQASRQRCCYVIAESKNSNFEWISHPSLPKHSVGMLNFPLNWSNFICSKRTDGSSPHEFHLFDLHHLVDLLCVRTVIAV